MANTEVGRPTTLDNELLGKIRKYVLEGKLDKEIAELINVPYDTFAHWRYRNYDNFDDNMRLYKQERMLKKAERNLDEIMDLDPMVEVIGAFGPIRDKITGKTKMKTSAELLKIKKDASEFVAETIGRKDYAKRREVDSNNKNVTVNVTPEQLRRIVGIGAKRLNGQGIVEAGIPGILPSDGQALRPELAPRSDSAETGGSAAPSEEGRKPEDNDLHTAETREERPSDAEVPGVGAGE